MGVGGSSPATPSSAAGLNPAPGFRAHAAGTLAHGGRCFAALPLYISDYAQLRREASANAFFESMSGGLTTTCATVIVGLQDAPPGGCMIWRALLQWDGRHRHPSRTADPRSWRRSAWAAWQTVPGHRGARTASKKVLPRVREIATAIVVLYVGFTGESAAIAYPLDRGMSGLLDALASTPSPRSRLRGLPRPTGTTSARATWTTPAIQWDRGGRHARRGRRALRASTCASVSRAKLRTTLRKQPGARPVRLPRRRHRADEPVADRDGAATRNRRRRPPRGPSNNRLCW